MNVDVGAHLKAVRQMYGLSQRELAKRAGVTNGLISLIEQNRVSPSVSSLKKVLDGIPMALADFFTLDLAGKPEDRQRLDGGGWQLLKEFTEVESGRRRSRPELAKALAYCKAHRAKLVVARLDRLTRNTRFLLDLVDSRVEPLFCDLPVVSALWAR